jgi:hypothetical protein
VAAGGHPGPVIVIPAGLIVEEHLTGTASKVVPSEKGFSPDDLEHFICAGDVALYQLSFSVSYPGQHEKEKSLDEIKPVISGPLSSFHAVGAVESLKVGIIGTEQ